MDASIESRYVTLQTDTRTNGENFWITSQAQSCVNTSLREYGIIQCLSKKQTQREWNNPYSIDFLSSDINSVLIRQQEYLSGEI